MTVLVFKRTGPVAGQYKVLARDQEVGHIRLSEATPPATPPVTPWHHLAYGQHEERTPTHGYERTREAMQAFAKSVEQGLTTRRGKAPETSLNPRPPTSVEATEVLVSPGADATR